MQARRASQNTSRWLGSEKQETHHVSTMCDFARLEMLTSISIRKTDAGSYVVGPDEGATPRIVGVPRPLRSAPF